MEQQNSKLELDMISLFYYLKKKVLVIAASVLVFALAGCLYSLLLVTPKYIAETRMYVLNRTNAAGVVSADFTISTYMLNDYKVLITGQNVTKEVISRLGLNMTPSGLSQKISVSSPNNTRILQISVSDTNAQRAADIANAVCEVAAVQIQEIMAVDAVHLVYTADVPQSPSNQNMKYNMGVSALAGLIVSVGVLALVYIVDDTIRTEEDVESYLGVCVLGVIPESGDIYVASETTSERKKRR